MRSEQISRYAGWPEPLLEASTGKRLSDPPEIHSEFIESYYGAPGSSYLKRPLVGAMAQSRSDLRESYAESAAPGERGFGRRRGPFPCGAARSPGSRLGNRGAPKVRRFANRPNNPVFPSSCT